jgi:tetratricopeptide (TPR) repeat protein
VEKIFEEAVMKNIKPHFLMTSIIILFFLVSCVGVNESFKQGQDFANQNRWEEAVQYFQKAVSEEPDNQQYKNALAGAKHQVARGRLARAKQSYASAGENFVSLERLAKEADTLLAMDPNDSEIKSFHATVNGKINGLKSNLIGLYQEAEKDMQREDWLAAMNKLKKVNEVFPNYEDTANRLKRCQSEGARSLYQQAINFGKEEDWKAASETFKQAMELNPAYLDVSKQYQAALQKDNSRYYVAEASKAEAAKKWDRALLLYEKAMDYPQADPGISKKLEELKLKASNIYFEESIGLLKEEKLYGAHKKIELARKYSASIQENQQYPEHTSRLFAALMKRADKYIEKEMWGNALIWLQKVESINPDYPELFQKVNDVKDPITRRVRKSIAVFDFGAPSTEKDAGKIAANKLIAFLHKNASVDLRIIERENLQSILREMQLSQTGLVDIKTAQSVGKMRGIDTFIMGDVLQYAHKYTDNPSVNQVKVMVDEEEVRNPDFSDWLILNPKPSEDDMKNAPPRTIKKKNYQLIPNKQGVAKITAMLEISFKLVDTQTGEIIANTVSGKLIKEDKYQEGLPLAKIVQDPLELPTEAEVLDELTNEKISEMGRHVLKHYQSLEVEYFNRGQDLQKRRNYEAALEKYIDAVYDEKLKGIATPISKKSLELIDMITKNY